MTRMTEVQRARARLQRAEEREKECTAALHDLVADAFPDDGEPQPTGGSPRGWKKQAAAASGYSGQGMTDIKHRVRAERRRAGAPVRLVPRAQALAALAGAHAEVKKAAAARERARAAYYAAIAAAMPPRRGEGERATREEAAVLKELRRDTGFDTSFLRRIQAQVEDTTARSRGVAARTA